MRVLALILALLPLPALAQTLAEPEGAMAEGREVETEAGFRAWIQDYRVKALEAGISAATWDREMRGATFLPDVVRRDRNQNEFTRTIWDYLDIAVSDERVAMGQAALKKHGPLLEKIEAQYGVRKEIVLAVWGLETSYGNFRGNTDTISALATLTYDGRREAFFGEQLLQALRILEAGEISRADMQGSWAGAMGHTQFMPTSWRDFAVDFDGDGKRNLWSDDPADALASAAHYLAEHGWAAGVPWGMEVTLPKGFDYDLTSERVVKTAAEWAALGVTPAAGGALPAGERVSILVPAGAQGAAFAIWPNFQAIESYNPADAYVIAIGHLADRIAGGEPIRTAWPRHWKALTLEERKEVQERLSAAGFDAGGVDGRIGPKTVAAVKAWQRARGLVADGYASPDVLRDLRGK
ncbi:lytic murein transglycosylase [Xinfangfangia sp. D13-10-4-6]|uniref:lytic murein transglycosylase n=1 Tax=Pseudogemmobacter hezensis TaxID=2737662 RepID=UPI00155474A4|nr:lytic murein transglycosylase [Pseudogemmobacter hezensis]NPD16594.1 lytic murein transglycosylase [Pseudogemmobacter hezensis]